MIDKKLIVEFCKHCDWAYQAWQLRKHMFDDNPRKTLLWHPDQKHFFNMLALILQEYWLQEVAKLHDPAIQNGAKNLSVNYILDHIEWPPHVKEELENVARNLGALPEAIRPARNKLLAHHDLNTIRSGKWLGGFENETDLKYFEQLQLFVNLAHAEVIGGPYPFDSLIKNDVAGFMEAIARGIRT